VVADESVDDALGRRIPSGLCRSLDRGQRLFALCASSFRRAPRPPPESTTSRASLARPRCKFGAARTRLVFSTGDGPSKRTAGRRANPEFGTPHNDAEFRAFKYLFARSNVTTFSGGFARC